MNNYISVYLSVCLHTHVYIFMYVGAYSKMCASIWRPENRVKRHSLDIVHILFLKTISCYPTTIKWAVLDGQWTLGFLCMDHHIQLTAYFTCVHELKLWSSVYKRTTLRTELSPEARLYILLYNHDVVMEHHRDHRGTLTLE